MPITTGEALETWILYMLEKACARDGKLVDKAHSAFRDLLDRTAENIRSELPNIYSRELAEVIFVNSY